MSLSRNRRGGIISETTRFDLDAEIAKNPPRRKHKSGLFDDPRIKAWFDKLLRMREAGHPGITMQYLADVLTKGARAEGIIPQDAKISESLCSLQSRRWLAAQKPK